MPPLDAFPPGEVLGELLPVFELVLLVDLAVVVDGAVEEEGG